MKLSATEVYEKLINEDKILEKKGEIRFKFNDIDLLVKQKDVVDNIMQEWLEEWLRKNNVEFKANANTQMPPDVYLNPDDETKKLVEVKAFNYRATPGFDIADFNMYQNPKTRELSGVWKSNFIRSYAQFYDKRLNIPRWYDIEDDYINGNDNA